MNYKIITNNPLVLEQLGRKAHVEYSEASFYDLLLTIRDRVHKGYKLLSHPLSGSVKPMETPYKSVMVSNACSSLDIDSLKMIESSIEACKKFDAKFSSMPQKTAADYQLVDLALIKGALSNIS